MPPTTPQQRAFLADVMRRPTQSHRTGLPSPITPSLGSTPREYEAFLIDQIRHGNKAVIDAIRNDKIRREEQYRMMQRYTNDNRQVEMQGWDEGYGSSGVRRRGEWSENLQRASAGNVGDVPQRWRYLKVLENARREAERMYGRTPEVARSISMYGGTPEAYRIPLTPKMGQSSPTTRERLASRISTQGGFYTPGTSPSMGNIATREGYGYQKTQTPGSSIDYLHHEKKPPAPPEPHPQGGGLRRAQWMRDRKTGRPFPDAPTPRREVVPSDSYEEFQKKHKARTNDPSWEELRLKVAEEKGYKCAVCGCGDTKGNALQLHHHTYDRLGHETTSDVDFLCRQHHKGDEKALHDYLYKRGLTLRQASKGLVKRGIDPYTGLYLEGAEYLDVKVPVGANRGKALQELTGYQWALMEERYEKFKGIAQGNPNSPMARFVAAWDFARGQHWYQRLIEPFHSIDDNLTPRDSFYDPLHPKVIPVGKRAFKGGPMWGVGEHGVVLSGEQGQQVMMQGEGPAGPGGSQVRMHVGQTAYGAYPARLADFYEKHDPLPFGSYSGMPMGTGIPKNEPMTPYRWRGMGDDRDLFPSRANEQKMVKEYDPEKSMSKQRAEYWKRLGGIPSYDEYGFAESLKGGVKEFIQPDTYALNVALRQMRKRGASDFDMKNYREWYMMKFRTPVYYGAREQLEYELGRLRNEGVPGLMIQQYKRAWVQNYALFAEHHVDKLMGIHQEQEVIDRLGRPMVQEGGPEEDPLQVRATDPATREGEEERSAALRDVEYYGEPVEQSLSRHGTKDFSVRGRGKLRRGMQEIDLETMSNITPEDLDQYTNWINSAPDQGKLDEIWETIVGLHKEDNALKEIRKQVLIRGGMFNTGSKGLGS